MYLLLKNNCDFCLVSMFSHYFAISGYFGALSKPWPFSSPKNGTAPAVSLPPKWVAAWVENAGKTVA